MKIFFFLSSILITQLNATINISKLDLKSCLVENKTKQKHNLLISFSNVCHMCNDKTIQKKNLIISSNQSTLIKHGKTKISNIIPLSNAKLKFSYGEKVKPSFIIVEKKEFDFSLANFHQLMKQDPNYYAWKNNLKPVVVNKINLGFSSQALISLYENIYNKEKKRLKNSVSMQPKINKIIHQIWLGNEKPLIYKKFEKSWKKLHPTWKYICWTEKIIKKSFGTLINKKAYDQANNYAKKSDILRYELLYNYGGLYVDCDILCFESFDTLNKLFHFYAGMEANTVRVFIQNAFIASISKHPILFECIKIIDHYQRNHHKVTHLNCFFNTLITSGPICFTMATFNVLGKQNTHDIIFPAGYFFPWSRSNHQPSKLSPESYCNHVSLCPIKKNIKYQWEFQTID